MSSVSFHESSEGVKHSQVMVPTTTTLLVSFTCDAFAMTMSSIGSFATYFNLLCGGLVSSTANFIHAALLTARQLLGFSLALLLLRIRCALVLCIPASIPIGYLFPLGLVLGFSGGSLLSGSLCMLDAVVHFKWRTFTGLFLSACQVLLWYGKTSSFGDVGYFFGCCGAGAVHSCSSFTFFAGPCSSSSATMTLDAVSHDPCTTFQSCHCFSAALFCASPTSTSQARCFAGCFGCPMCASFLGRIPRPVHHEVFLHLPNF